MPLRRNLVFALAAIPALLGAAEAADYTPAAQFFQGDVLRPSITPKLGGFVVGAIGGYTFGEVDHSASFLPSLGEDEDLTGADGGFLVGYELTNGPFFTGFELLAFAGGPENSYDFDGGVTLDYGIDGHVDARFRSGWMFTDRIAGYGIVGATVARVSLDASDGQVDYEDEDWLLGWVGGGGLEFLLNHRFSFAAEYTFSGLEQETYGDDEDLTVDSGFHAVRAALRARF